MKRGKLIKKLPKNELAGNNSKKEVKNSKKKSWYQKSIILLKVSDDAKTFFGIMLMDGGFGS